MSSPRTAGRFSRRVFLAVAVTLAAVSATFTAYFTAAQKRRLEGAVNDRSHAIGGLLASSARTTVFSENAALIQETLSIVVGRRDVLAAAVFSAEGRTIATEGRTRALREGVGRLGPADLAVVRQLGPESLCLNREDAATIEVYCTVLLRERGVSVTDLFFEEHGPAPGQKSIGFVRVTLDRTPLQQDIAQLLRRSLALMAGVLLLGVWAGHRFARHVTEPLERLTAAVRAFGAGGDTGDLSRMPDNEIGGLAAAFTGMTRDLRAREREKEQLAERLRHAQKMEAVGALSQGISHDFKNILSTLKIAVHLLERSSAGNEAALKYTDRMKATLDRARELVERLLTFSRTQELTPGDVDLAALLGRLAPAFRTALGEHVRLQLEPAEGAVRVWGDAASLEQLLMNLVYNARDAMAGAGVLQVRLGIVPGEGGGPPMARISVRDTGVGMAPEERSRIFDPFYTTKGSGGGMGLGLSIVRGIVEEHRGRVDVESSPGEGTTFHVDLPLARERAAGAVRAEGGAP